MSPSRAGRPKRGTDLEPFTARLTPDAKRRLMALAQIQDTNAYEVMEQAFWDFWNGLPAAQREATEALLALVDKARKARAGGAG
jgi:predicted transcriptional regulator